jgi:hypothetical protein
MANVLNDEKKQQVLALGRLGWSLRRIQQATGVRRETASIYLKTAGIAVRPAGAWGRGSALPVSPKISTRADAGQCVIGLASGASPSNPANELITDSAAANPANEVITDFGAGKRAYEAIPTNPDLPKPADGVITGSGLFRAATEIPATSDGLAHLQPQAESGSCPHALPLRQCLRTLSRADRSRSRPRSQCHGHLARRGVRLRLQQRLSECSTLRPQAPETPGAASSSRDPNRSRRRLW